MKPRSAKNKGKRLQNKVRDLILEKFDTLEPDDIKTEYPSNMAEPTKILIEASNGASDYGNKFGEPIVNGFTRSFRANIKGERREWVKPIMFTGGLGIMQECGCGAPGATNENELLTYEIWNYENYAAAKCLNLTSTYHNLNLNLT